MKALLVEDHQLLRQSLIACLQRCYVDWTFGEAESIQAARLALRTPWDVVILDLLLPDGSGFDLLPYIKSARLKTKVIVLTSTAEQDYGIAALSEGADAFLTKRASMTELFEAIDCLCAGRRYLSPSMAERVLEVHSRPGKSAKELSRRELDVLHFVGQGLPASQIAAALKLSPRTVESYRSRISKKLAVKGKAGLIRYVMTKELTPSGTIGERPRAVEAAGAV